MNKKVYIEEDKLMKLKNAMASNSTSHSAFMSEDRPPYEEDEFEIGGEGGNNDFFHVNEGYCSSKLKNIDLSEVGRVECECYFDEEEYNEWLVDNELTDSEENRIQYFKDVIDYQVTYLDNETFHCMETDYAVLYDDLEKLFGEKMAQNILYGCMKNNKYEFETYELYSDNTYDLSNPNEVNDIAMKLFRHGEYFKDCRGFILSNGVIVYTEAEHNEITAIPGLDNKFDFIRMGNIRLLPNSIDIGAEPTYEQEEVLRQVIGSYSEEELYLDIFDNHNEIGVKYIQPDWRYVIGEINRYYSEGIKPQGKDNIYENIESEVEANDVNLNSFKKRSELAPKIWDGEKLNSRARLKLLDIADDFWESTNVNWVKPKAIHLTGSICNYNWSKYSDIDLHLVVDFSEVDKKTEFVQEYFNGKKNEWNEEHSNLKIFGFPVELYVEDINAETQSGGLYDLEENDWIKKPSSDSIKPIGLNKYGIKDKSADLMTRIDDLIDLFKKTDDDAELRKIGRKAHLLLSKIKRMRKSGLERGGESDPYNIIYKVLRRTGRLDMLWKLNSNLYDKLNSIDETIIKEDVDFFSLSKERFGTTFDIRECGYILPDGTMLDFSGRHSLNKGTDSSHLAGRRAVDHREIEDIGWSIDGNTKIFDFGMNDIINLGAIRTHVSNNYCLINLRSKPTNQQISVITRIVQYAKGCAEVEISNGDETLSYAEYDEANPRRVVNDIIRYFDEGIKLIGNVTENKVIKEYFNKFISLNEEIVADGNAEHNPFKQRWKHERETLINYLLNYGELMTSKENGKQYKVLFDVINSP